MKLLSEFIQNHDFNIFRFDKTWEYWIIFIINYQKKEISDFSIQILSEMIKFFSFLNILSYAIYFIFNTLFLIFKHIADKNVFSHVFIYMHVFLAFFWSLALISKIMMYIQTEISWAELIFFLNLLNQQDTNEFKLLRDVFSLSNNDITNYLSEDFFMWEQIWN